MSVLVLADHDAGALTPSTGRIVAAAAGLGPVDLLVAGHDVGALGAEAATLAGVARVRVADAPALAEAPADALADLLSGVAADYTHVVAAASAIGRDVIPRLAAMLNLMPVTDVVRILGPDRFIRPIYAGNALQTVASPQSRQLLTLRASAFPAGAKGDAAPIEALAYAGSTSIAFVSAQRTEGTRPDLSTAALVVAGGVSFGSAESFATVEKLADLLGGAVGATRAAVDAGYAPNDWQVGQTGKIIAPDLYIGVGISGALQHLAGIQGAKRIVAINTDPDAPLMKIADLALVGDLNTVLPALIAEIERLGLKR